MLLYRGFNNNYSNMGVRPNQKGIWMTDDEEYANEYSELFKNGAIAEIDIDDNANIANAYDCREVFKDEEDIEEYLYDLGGDLEFDNQICDKLLEAGYDGLFFDDYGKDCYYIFNSKVIKGYKIIKTFQNDREDAMESIINNILKNAGVKLLIESSNDLEIRDEDGKLTLLQNGYIKAECSYAIYNDRIVINWIESFDEGQGYATKLLEYIKNKHPDIKIISGEFVSSRIANIMKKLFGEPIKGEMPTAKNYDEYLNNNNASSSDMDFKLNESLDFYTSVKDSYGDELHCRMTVSEDGKDIGYLDFSVYEDTPYIQMINVKEPYRRKGYATKMIKQLQKEYPNSEIDFGMTTDDGTKLVNSLPFDTKVNIEYDKKVKQAKKLKKWLDEFKEFTDKVYQQIDNNEPIAEKNRLYIVNNTDKWQKYKNKYEEILDWIRENKRETKFVKVDENSKKS